jgi:hypothetical protein
VAGEVTVIGSVKGPAPLWLVATQPARSAFDVGGVVPISHPVDSQVVDAAVAVTPEAYATFGPPETLESLLMLAPVITGGAAPTETWGLPAVSAALAVAPLFDWAGNV